MMTLIPKQKNKELFFGSLLLSQLLFVLVGFFISVLISYSYISYMDLDVLLESILIFGSIVVLYHMQDFYRRYLFSVKKFKDVLILDSISYCSRVIIFSYYLVFSIPLSLIEVFVIFSGTFGLGVIFGALKFKFKYSVIQVKKDFYVLWDLSKWLLLSGLMQWTSINSFIVAASIFLGPISVGIIKIGQNIIFAFNIVIQGLENFVPIDASKNFIEKGYSGLFTYLKNVTYLGCISVFVFILTLITFADNIILMLYNEMYIEYSYVLYWYSIILIFMFLLSIYRIFVRTIGKTKILFKSYFIASSYSIMVVYPLEVNFGIEGVLFGILSAHIVLLLSIIFLIKKSDLWRLKEVS